MGASTQPCLGLLETGMESDMLPFSIHWPSRKNKVTEINFVGLQKDEENFPGPLLILQC